MPQVDDYLVSFFIIKTRILWSREEYVNLTRDVIPVALKHGSGVPSISVRTPAA